MKALIDQLAQSHILTREELMRLIENRNPELDQYLFAKADAVRREIYGNDIYIRGLIELSNYCKNDCYYCGIRRSNKNAARYRLTLEQVLDCCKAGYELGFRTFVLQGGEDPYFTDERLSEMISAIKSRYPDCALTLSMGEKSYASYLSYFNAGADRYLLRHETADATHYGKLHPDSMTLSTRRQCLYDLKKIGFQVGVVLWSGLRIKLWKIWPQICCLSRSLILRWWGSAPLFPIAIRLLPESLLEPWK